MNEYAQRYREYLENLTLETLDELPEFVTEDVHFKDPFNDTHGVAAMADVFRHMFENVSDIRFTVNQMMHDDDTCLMGWHFEGVLSRENWSFEGTSVISFSLDGRVCAHIDHWDAARNLYERLPIIGWLLSRLRRKMASHS